MSFPRRVLASLCLLIAFGFAAAIATLPWFKADKPGIIVLIALTAGLILAGRAGWRRPGKAMLAVLLTALLAIPAVVIARGFGRVDMFAVLFHVDVGMQGGGAGNLRNEILQGIISLTVIVLCFQVLTALWNLRPRVVWAFAFVLLLANPVTQFAILNLLRPALNSDLPQKIFPPKLAQGVTDAGDIVVIYVEGTDRQFADPAVWGDAYAPLTQLAAKGMALTGVRQVTGTGWSMAGMMSSLCGVPALPRGLAYRNNYEGAKAFMPNITCLGDLVKPLGYGTTFVMGVDLDFSGVGQFYRDHGFATVLGRSELAARLPQEVQAKSLIEWVFDDHVVMGVGREEHAKLMASDAPFLLVVETIGPHGKTGFLSHSCTPDGVGLQTTDARAVLACTLNEVVDFVAYVQAEQAAKRPGRPLHIIVQSDHLSHNADTPPVDPAYQNANTVIYLGPNAPPGTVIAREASMIDVLPTTLQVTGLAAAPVAANLGRSVLSMPKTLLEEHGEDRLNDLFARDGALAAKVWE